MTAAAVKALMESHLSLAERTGDAKVCGEAASTAVAMFPEDEDFKYSECTNVDELMNAGFSGPTTAEAFNKHLTMLEDIYMPEEVVEEGLFSNWNEWNTDLPSLKTNLFYKDEFGIWVGCSPFANGPLETFSGQLPNLTAQMRLFAKMHELVVWKSDLPNLVNGYGMFSGCENLVDFSAVLPNLLSGNEMFRGCTSLSDDSVRYIAQNINDISNVEYDMDMFDKYGI